jgi:hypothetical protein
MKTDPLMSCLPRQSAEIVEELTTKFLQKQIGKNDMAVINGLMATAAIMLVTHCQITGEDFEDMVADHADLFRMAAKVAWDNK